MSDWAERGKKCTKIMKEKRNDDSRSSGANFQGRNNTETQPEMLVS